MNFIFEGSVPSDLNEVKIFVEQVLGKLKKIINDNNVMFDIRLILNELIINGVIHGNECDVNKQVYLLLQIKDGVIRIEVADEGKGIERECLNYNPKDLKCCGRGLVIASGLSDEFHIDRNRIVSIKHIL